MTEADLAPRAVFGRYIRSLRQTGSSLEHRQTAVLDCHIAGERPGFERVWKDVMRVNTLDDFDDEEDMDAQAQACGGRREVVWSRDLPGHGLSLRRDAGAGTSSRLSGKRKDEY
jgi:hypothetical protein